MDARAKFLIVDQSLRDTNGHHFEYDLSIAKAAAQAGFMVAIAAHKHCDRNLSFGEFKTLYWFQRAWDEIPESRVRRLARRLLSTLPSGMRHATLRVGARIKAGIVTDRADIQPNYALPTFGKELVALTASEQLDGGDHVLVHTLGNDELHAAISALAEYAKLPNIHIVLRRDAEEPAVRSDPWGGISAALDHAMRRFGDRIRLYTDTDALTFQYKQLAPGATIKTLPIALELVDEARSQAPRADGPLRLTYLGNARTEKGFHLLPHAVAALEHPFLTSGQARFVIQCNASLDLEDQAVVDARAKLSRHGAHKVELIGQALQPNEFQRRLIAADIIILPYEASLYRRRSSGILIQALTAGRPLVVPAETWMSDTMPADCGIVFSGPADLPRAIASAIEAIPRLSAAARDQAPQWRAEHNASLLVDRLIA